MAALCGKKLVEGLRPARCVSLFNRQPHEAREHALTDFSTRTVASTAEVRTGPRPAVVMATNYRGLLVQKLANFEAYLRGLVTYRNEAR